LSQAKCSGLLIASIYFYLKFNTVKNVKIFLEWVVYNNIYDISEINADSIIKIYESTVEAKSKTVFVSMPFGNKYIDRHYEMIELAVNEINTEFNQSIKLKAIRMDKFNQGYSYQVFEKILELIQDSGLMIADLTSGNKNVYQELGFLMGLDTAKGLGLKNFIVIFKEDKKKKKATEHQIGFNIRGLQQLRFTELHDLKVEIRKSLIIYYGLKY
jgi:hypothetical protein